VPVGSASSMAWSRWAARSPALTPIDTADPKVSLGPFSLQRGMSRNQLSEHRAGRTVEDHRRLSRLARRRRPLALLRLPVQLCPSPSVHPRASLDNSRSALWERRIYKLAGGQCSDINVLGCLECPRPTQRLRWQRKRAAVCPRFEHGIREGSMKVI
jgi:hypothetical protein